MAQMTSWLYTLRQRFTPAISDAASDHEFKLDWQSYLDFSGFQHLSEVITLDSLLCPEVIVRLLPEDWDYNVHEDFKIYLFRDAEYLVGRQVIDPQRQQVLAVYPQPTGTEIPPSGFQGCGYDLMDDVFEISTLTNCGAAPEMLDPSLVNEFGLLSSYSTALEIRDRMRQYQPEDHHFKSCDIWAVARKKLVT